MCDEPIKASQLRDFKEIPESCETVRITKALYARAITHNHNPQSFSLWGGLNGDEVDEVISDLIDLGYTVMKKGEYLITVSY